MNKVLILVAHYLIEVVVTPFAQGRNEILNDPEIAAVLKVQVLFAASESLDSGALPGIERFSIFLKLSGLWGKVQECLSHVRALNAKLAEGCSPDSAELKVPCISCIVMCLLETPRNMSALLTGGS